MSNSLTAVVTGASKGIGRAIALRYAKAGYRVWALARSEGDLEALQHEEKGIVPLRIDVQNPAEIAQACAKILAETGAPSTLVNNAGIAISAPLFKTSLEDFERVMDINLRAPFLFCQQLGPAMVEAGGGRIINIGSSASVKGARYTSAYCASKHALLGLTRSLALEVAAKGMTVNALCPGWVDTEMLSRSTANISRTTGKSEAEARATIAKMNPMGRFVRPEDVAELCFFLSGEAASNITGACYVMDSGETV